MRAMYANIKARRLVAGGSTLTQQTAKNLYYRPDRSLRSKWNELLNALRLEAHYSKDEILEFYFNQFHVAGNGRGLGIAARYYFDKSVADLSLQECAFIAGSVKAPARYNPFIGRTEEARQKAAKSAANRTHYVLRRMSETGAIGLSLYDTLRDEPLNFKRGEFRFKPSTTLDAVEARLSRPPFPELFEHLGIEDPLNSGLQIITTLDKNAQRWAQYGLRHHLSNIGSFLEKAKVGDLIDKGGRPPVEAPAEALNRGDLYRGNIVRHEGKGKNRVAFADLGGGTLCRIDAESVQRVAQLIKRAKTGKPWSPATKRDVKDMWSALTPGDSSLIVELSVRDGPTSESEAFCDIEFSPMLEGAILMMEAGRVRAMAGGAQNRYFNRATDAKRQFGSIWKVLIYEAALELGWTLDEPLDNRLNAFPFEGSWYYPRPDHTPEPFVDMSEAGTKSENLASVWLLYRLVDKLHARQLEHLAGRLELAPSSEETHKEYLVRMRDSWGILDTKRQQGSIAFEWARRQAQAELELRLKSHDARELASMHYGTGFEAQWRKIEASRSLKAEEKLGRLSGLRRNFLYLHRQLPSCRERYDFESRSLLEALTDRTELESSMKLLVRSRENGIELACSTRVWDGWSTLDEFEGPSFATREIPFEEILVDGVISVGGLSLLESWVSRGFDWVEQKTPYTLERLVHHPDFRRLLAMLHVGKLAQSLGVASELKPILSMPLGATELTLSEAVVMYRGLITGDTMRVRGKIVANDEGWEPSDAPSAESFYTLIDEIRDSTGRVLYQTTMEDYSVVDSETRGNVLAILRSVVDNGTGRRVSAIKTDDGVTWPLAGKTGTSNSYRNATFLGAVPVWREGQWSLKDSWIVGSYVGYDNNKPMKRGGMRISGANGALPIWKIGVEGIITSGSVGRPNQGDEAWIPPGFERVVYGDSEADESPRYRLMPVDAPKVFRPHNPPPIEWAPLEVTTTTKLATEGISESLAEEEVDPLEESSEEAIGQLPKELGESNEPDVDRGALESALSSLAGRLRGEQKERENSGGRYAWLRISQKSKDATDWTSVTRLLAAQQALVFDGAQDAFEILYRSRKAGLLSSAEETLWADVVDAFVLDEVKAFTQIMGEEPNSKTLANVLEGMLELDAFVGPGHPWLTDLQTHTLARWEETELRTDAEDASNEQGSVEPEALPNDSGAEGAGDGFLGGLRDLFKTLGDSKPADGAE